MSNFNMDKYREMLYGKDIKSDKDKHKVPDNIKSEIKGIWLDKKDGKLKEKK
tara:strand:+ start:258 stop:413 length:156 start_codon:yes stop_codon:yes gene_type:complete